MKLYAPWEKAFKKISTPFEHFLHAQTTTGLALMLTTVLALILANSSLSDAYAHILHTNIDLTIGSWSLSHPIHYWINDGLMTFFFFIIGLEIKREVMEGELSNIRVAILPILAAIGGMIFPALLYLSINGGGEGAIGWGIPMATDIAFAISVLVLLKKSIPTNLITFLVALAIVDDLGAVLVIATFYTEQIHLLPLAFSGVAFLILVVFNRVGIHTMLPYLAVGLFMWFFMLESGVHATISGVIAAMAIPSTPKRLSSSFSEQIKGLLNEYDEHSDPSEHKLNERQKTVLMKMERNIDEVGTPAARLENNLHLPIALIVIPLFALANAGIAIDLDSIGTTITQPIPVGIMLGLVFGKIIGIFGISWLAIKSKIATLPEGSTMSQIFGISLLGGIGFTMSIFVADLAFLGSPDFIFQSKVGVLAASLFAGVSGYVWLKYIAKSAEN
ncbi:Na+/H+ antiporter NhaA type [hydrothermal vent metagenome]|uniref:Na+/H+ antiporter NhaA type n=1 Tax=hydrothermal vent metagenome TaxID=652676 RepID=A0A1W1E731_9ZZZZ